jgi:hypothetical protein
VIYMCSQTLLMAGRLFHLLTSRLWLMKSTLFAFVPPILISIIYFSGDSCCVDEVAAQHVNADAMVHYGHACMSQ